MQGVVALSTMEAEYIALTSAAQSLAWTQSLVVEMRIAHTNKQVIHGDTISSHFLTGKSCLHRPWKHIDVPYQYIHKQYE